MDDNNNQSQIEKQYRRTVENLESRIKNNGFSSKEELADYLIELRTNGIPESFLSNEKMLELLNMYDELHKVTTATLPQDLNLDSYKEANLENQNLIIEEKSDTILKTTASSGELAEEFRRLQNEITSQNLSGLTNASEVFEKMKNTEKEQLTLLPLQEAVSKDNVDTEILTKIRFFATNGHINPFEYQVDIESGIFYNVETNEALEVRKNEETGSYEIHRSGEKTYQNVSKNDESTKTQEMTTDSQVDYEKTSDSESEEMAYENKNVKVRRLIKPPDINQAAFVKSSFIIIVITIFSIFLAILALSLRK